MLAGRAGGLLGPEHREPGDDPGTRARRVDDVVDEALSGRTVGLTDAVPAIALSGPISPILTGTPQGPLADPVAIVPVLLDQL